MKKNYKYKITLNQKDKQPIVYKTETYELAKNLKTLWTNFRKIYNISEKEFYAEIENI